MDDDRVVTDIDEPLKCLVINAFDNSDTHGLLGRNKPQTLLHSNRDKRTKITVQKK
jgi:hypothetical protein